MAGTTARLVAGGLLGATVLALAGCGTDRGGSVALGDGPVPAVTTPSNSGVVFVPLDSPSPGGGTPSGAGPTPGASTRGGGAAGGSSGGTGAHAGSGTGGRTGGSPGAAENGNGAGPGRTPGGTGGVVGGTGTGGGTAGGSSGGTGTGGGTAGGGTGGTPTPAPGGGGVGAGTPQTPAALAVTALRTADTGTRWCQRVTLTLVNSGDTAATSGTVTFATHVIGALGIDWWTYQTSQPLAAPVAGHASADESWTICLDAWRVPAGMHLETRTATLG